MGTKIHEIAVESGTAGAVQGNESAHLLSLTTLSVILTGFLWG
jgi:hypothetical protein